MSNPREDPIETQTLKADTLPLSRRAFLQELGLGVAGMSLLAPLVAEAGQTAVAPKPYPFKLGLQAASLRSSSLEDALARTRMLGLHWWEGDPVHLPVTDDTAKIASYRQMLHAHGVAMGAYGVVDFANDEAAARRTFQFAKALGADTITATPSADALPLLDKLTQEFQINIGIVNQGSPDDPYGTRDKVMAAIQGVNPRIGACDDTGQYLRTESNPITAVTMFNKRLYSIHLKNVKQGPGKTKVSAPIGALGGLLDVVQMLRFLKDQKYQGLLAITEEEPAENPMSDLRASVEAMKRYINTVNTIMLRPG